MRKSKQETVLTRARIVEAASFEFRRNGIDRTGLNELMAAAGLTRGGFYRHFSSKDQIITEAYAQALHSQLERIVALTADAKRTKEAIDFRCHKTSNRLWRLSAAALEIRAALD